MEIGISVVQIVFVQISHYYSEIIDSTLSSEKNSAISNGFSFSSSAKSKVQYEAIVPSLLLHLHPGCRLRASGICPIPCTHLLPKSPLRASVKMAFLVARIGAQKKPCVHPFQK